MCEFLIRIPDEIYGEVIIPNAVYKEVCVKEDSPCQIAVSNFLNWIKIKKIQNEMARQNYNRSIYKMGENA